MNVDNAAIKTSKPKSLFFLMTPFFAVSLVFLALSLIFPYPINFMLRCYASIMPGMGFFCIGLVKTMRWAGFRKGANGNIEAQSPLAMQIERVARVFLRITEIIFRVLFGGGIIAGLATIAPSFFAYLVSQFLLNPIPSTAGSILVSVGVVWFFYDLGWDLIRELLGERDIGYISCLFPFAIAGALGDLSLSGWQGQFYFSDLLPVIGTYIGVMLAEGILMEVADKLRGWFDAKPERESTKQKRNDGMVQESALRLQAGEYPQISVEIVEQGRLIQR